MKERNFTLQWHLTVDCPYNCSHCYLKEPSYLKEKQNELDTEQSFKIIDKFKQFVDKLNLMFNTDIKPLIRFTGGDPLLRKNFFKLLEYSQQNGVKTSVLGNPDLLDNDNCLKMKTLGVRSYQISLDGEKELHEKYRKKGSYDISFNALKLLKNNGIKPFVMFNYQKENKDDIFPLFDKILDEDLARVTFARVVPIGNAKNLDLEVTPIEYRNFLDNFYTKYTKDINDEKIHMKEPLFSLLMYEKGYLKPNNDSFVSSGCEAGISFMSMQSNGDIHICRRMDSLIGNALTDSFEDVFFNNDMINEIRDFDSYEKCNTCVLKFHCRGCPAIAKTNGGIYKPDPQCWK